MSKAKFAAAASYLAVILISPAPALARPNKPVRTPTAGAIHGKYWTATPRLLPDRSVILRGVIAAPRAITVFCFEYRRLGGRDHKTGWFRVPRRSGVVVVIARLQHLPAGTTYRYRLAIIYRSRRRYGAQMTVSTAASARPTKKPRGRTVPGPQPTRVAAPTPPPQPSRAAVPAPVTPRYISPPASSLTSSTTQAWAPTVSGSLAADTSTTSSATATDSGLGGRSLLWGAQIGPQLTGGEPPWDMSAATAFANLVGKAPGILPFNLPFTTCSGECSWYSFPTVQMSAIRQYGSIPMINWSSMSDPLSAAEPRFTLAAVTRGDFDTYLRSFAAGAAAWGHPFFLRFNWEMNGNWFPWGEGGNGNQPGDFVAAWRHVHDIFAAAGATNVNWVWCPSVTTTNAMIDLRELYPGDAYVDWTCMDGYNWGELGGGAGGWQSFSHVFGATYSELTTNVAPSKPMMIGEMASSELGGSRAAWITDMFSNLATQFPQIRALIWFDAYDGSYDWPVEASSSALAAFSLGIGGARVANNDYANLAGTSIAAP